MKPSDYENPAVARMRQPKTRQAAREALQLVFEFFAALDATRPSPITKHVRQAIAFLDEEIDQSAEAFRAWLVK